MNITLKKVSSIGFDVSKSRSKTIINVESLTASKHRKGRVSFSSSRFVRESSLSRSELGRYFISSSRSGSRNWLKSWSWSRRKK